MAPRVGVVVFPGTNCELDAIYALRYQVYCVERGFLDPTSYPDQRERDSYDEISLHYGLYSLDDQLAGTMRLVRGRLNQLPLAEHCELYPERRTLLASPCSKR